MGTKIPVSTLVLVYTPDLRVLLIERADAADYWQSVTGSLEPGETLAETASRELLEETGIDAAAHGGLNDWKLSNVYEIYPRWRHRYPPGITHNTEHVFALQVPEPVAVRLDPREHRSLRMAAVAGRGRQVLLVVEPRRDPSVAGARRAPPGLIRRLTRPARPSARAAPRRRTPPR